MSGVPRDLGVSLPTPANVGASDTTQLRPRCVGVLRHFACALILTILSTDAYAQISSSSNTARQYVLGETQGLRVVAWIKEEATPADHEWFRLEIDNAGPDLVVRRAAIVAPGEYGNNKVDDLAGTLPLNIPARGQVGPFDTFVLPSGRFTTYAPGTFIAAWLGSHNVGVSVTMRLTFSATRINADPIILSNPETITFRWSRPGSEQMDALKRQTSALLERAFVTNNPLTLAEQVKLRALLQTSEINKSIAIEEVLAAAGRRQRAQRFELSELATIILHRWQTEPKVVGFLDDALRDRAPGAIADLSMSAKPPWDDSLLEPIVSLVERISQERSAKPWELQITIERALAYLDRTHTQWGGDPAISPRLSSAILRFSPVPEPGGMYRWADMLALTHDPSLLKVLRPYLTDSTLDSFTSASSNMPHGVTPMRYSELAANAICRLLGEPIMFSPYRRSKAPSGGPYPEWAEWDMRLAALQQRLDALAR